VLNNYFRGLETQHCFAKQSRRARKIRIVTTLDSIIALPTLTAEFFNTLSQKRTSLCKPFGYLHHRS